MLYRLERSWIQHTLIPAIAQLVEHLTVEHRSDQMVPASIPGGRRCVSKRSLRARYNDAVGQSEEASYMPSELPCVREAPRRG